MKRFVLVSLICISASIEAKPAKPVVQPMPYDKETKCIYMSGAVQSFFIQRRADQDIVLSEAHALAQYDFRKSHPTWVPEEKMWLKKAHAIPLTTNLQQVGLDTKEACMEEP